MATHKTDLAFVSLNQLTQLTGQTYRTIKKKLTGVDPADQDGRTLIYHAREALDRIYYGNPEERSDDEGDNPDGPPKFIDRRYHESRQVKLKADHLEFDLDVKRGKFVMVEMVRKMLNDRMIAFRTRLRQTSSQIAEEVEGEADIQKRTAIVERYHDEALNEMADDEIDDSPEAADDGSSEEAATAAEADDLPVG